MKLNKIECTPRKSVGSSDIPTPEVPVLVQDPSISQPAPTKGNAKKTKKKVTENAIDSDDGDNEIEAQPSTSNAQESSCPVLD